MFDNILIAFVIGGLICVLGQLFMDLTPFVVTPGHILVGYVTLGVIISALGYYEPLVNLAGAGATVPLSGFGHALAQGAIQGVASRGLVGAFAGGLEATATGIAIAIISGFTIATIFNPKG